jgi:anaerobic selenocysteine-containing dehydrogenase
MNDRDAETCSESRDNDWVEIINDHGVVVTRACVSARIPRGICFIYHATERTVGVPFTSERGAGSPSRQAEARWRSQQSHSRAPQAADDDRRIRSVQLLLQLLGTARESTATPTSMVRKTREDAPQW